MCVPKIPKERERERMSGAGTEKTLIQIRKSAEDACSTIVNLQSDILWPFWVHVEKEIVPKFLLLSKYRRAVRRRRLFFFKEREREKEAERDFRLCRQRQKWDSSID